MFEYRFALTCVVEELKCELEEGAVHVRVQGDNSSRPKHI